MRTIFTLISLAAVLALPTYASPTESSSSQELGCDAFGPLKSLQTVELANCDPGESYYCMVTDSTGCDAGDPSNIEQLSVVDVVTNQALAPNVIPVYAKAPFTCGQSGIVTCTVTFAEENESKLEKYGMRIVKGDAGI